MANTLLCFIYCHGCLSVLWEQKKGEIWQSYEEQLERSQRCTLAAVRHYFCLPTAGLSAGLQSQSDSQTSADSLPATVE